MLNNCDWAARFEELIELQYLVFGVPYLVEDKICSRCYNYHQCTVELEGWTGLKRAYSILPDKAFDYVLAELKRIDKTVMERWGSEESLLNLNRVILVGLPRFGAEES